MTASRSKLKGPEELHLSRSMGMNWHSTICCGILQLRLEDQIQEVQCLSMQMLECFRTVNVTRCMQEGLFGRL